MIESCFECQKLLSKCVDVILGMFDGSGIGEETVDDAGDGEPDLDGGQYFGHHCSLERLPEPRSPKCSSPEAKTAAGAEAGTLRRGGGDLGEEWGRAEERRARDRIQHASRGQVVHYRLPESDP